MSEITVNNLGFHYPNGENRPHAHLVSIEGFTDAHFLGEAELYAIKTALEKQVALNAEVERLRQRKQHSSTQSWVAKFPVTAAQ